MSKLNELLGQLEQAQTDLQSRADKANTAGIENRQKRERALVAYKAATVKGDKQAMREAQELVEHLDREFEMLQAQVEALMEALEGAGDSPLRPIALAIKEAAQKQGRERQAQWAEHERELTHLANRYLEVVAAMGQLQKQSAGGPAWEAAQHLLPRPLNILEGAVLPSHVHENQKGPVYKITPQAITTSFREGRPINV